MTQKRTTVAFYAGKEINILNDNRHCAVDAHGDIDIYAEVGWRNVKIITEQNQRSIQGINLNCLLKGMFILYGFETIDDSTLPGGFNCWEVMLESFFISLTHLCSIDDIIRRIYYLTRMYINGNGNEGSIDGDNYSIGNLLYGALSFLMYWILNFNVYLAEIHLTKLKCGIYSIGQILLIIQDNDELKRKNHYSYNYTEILNKCRQRYHELQEITNKVTQSRLLNTIGINYPLSSNINRAATPPPTTSTTATNTSECIHHSYAQPNMRSYLPKSHNYDAKLKKTQLKETIAAAPAVKLDIFGADALFDTDSSEDEEVDDQMRNNTTNNSHNNRDKKDQKKIENIVVEEQQPLPPPPPVRINANFNLLQEPLALSLNIFEIDPLEFARQWTLSDHALFCSIPLSSLLPPPGTNTAIVALNRSQQAKLGILGTGIWGGVRAFIDRFNALSSWIILSILKETELQIRIKRITYFIKLASYMAELANFNGLMIVLTSLQQGCISRLKYSFDGISKSDRLKLQQLQKTMSGLRNYQLYRVEIAKLSGHFQLSTGGEGEGDRYSHIAWKRDVIMRYKPEASSNLSTTTINTNNTPISLMRSNSIQNMLSTTTASSSFPKSPQLDDEFSPWVHNFQGIVPHFGAHLAELTSINEGNNDYLLDRPYLYNCIKLKLLSHTLLLLNNMQCIQYNLSPIRTLISSINFIAKTHLKLSATAISEHSKHMYTLSLSVENDHNTNNINTTTTNHNNNNTISTNKNNKIKKNKTRKSTAYQRILNRNDSALQDDNNSNEEDEEDSSEDEEDSSEYSEESMKIKTKKKKFLSKSLKLMRTLTSVFTPNQNNGNK